jgi:hypothetical protein
MDLAGVVQFYRWDTAEGSIKKQVEHSSIATIFHLQIYLKGELIICRRFAYNFITP